MDFLSNFVKGKISSPPSPANPPVVPNPVQPYYRLPTMQQQQPQGYYGQQQFPYQAAPFQQPADRPENYQKMIDNIKLNFDGSAAAPTAAEIEKVLASCGWDEDRAVQDVHAMFFEKKIKFYTSIYDDLPHEVIGEVIGKLTEDSSIIVALNDGRRAVVKGLIDRERNTLREEERNRNQTDVANLVRQNEQLASEKNAIEQSLTAATEKMESLQQEINRLEILHSVDKQAHLDYQNNLSSELSEKAKVIAELESEAKFLEKELATYMNAEKNYADNLAALKSQNKELKTEIAEFLEAPFVKAPERALFGEAIPVRWRRKEHDPSEETDCIRLYDCENNLIQSQQISERKISGTLQFIAPEKFGDYYFTYSMISMSVFGLIADEDILCQSQSIRIGPTFVIVEEVTAPGSLTLSIRRDAGEPCFESFTIGMFRRGSQDSGELHSAIEGESVEFHFPDDTNLFEFEFRLYGQLDGGLLFHILTQGHTQFNRVDRKRRGEPTHQLLSELDALMGEGRDLKRRRNNDNSSIVIEEIVITYDNSDMSEEENIEDEVADEGKNPEAIELENRFQFSA